MVVMASLASPILGLTLSLQEAYLKSDSGLSGELPSRLNTLAYLSSVGSISPGYSAGEDRFFVTTRLPFPSKIHSIRKYSQESREFRLLAKDKELFYKKLMVNQLFHTLLFYDQVLLVQRPKKTSIRYQTLHLERKKAEAELKKLLQIPYSEPIDLQGALSDYPLRHYKLSKNSISDARFAHIDHNYAEKELTIEKTKLKSLSKSYLPNLLVTVEYWQERDLTTTSLGFEFPILDSRHSNSIKAVKQTVKDKEMVLLKVDNDVQIELSMMIEETNAIVDMISTYHSYSKDYQQKHVLEVLKLQARYATLVSSLNLIFY